MGGGRILCLLLLGACLMAPAHAVEPTPVEAAADPAEPFRAWLDRWLQESSMAARQLRDAVLPVEPEPGLDLRIDPDDESVYVGWRARF